MRFLHYKNNGMARLAVEIEEKRYDVAALCGIDTFDFDQLLKGGEEAIDAIAESLTDTLAVEKAEISGEIEYAPAVPNPGKILCIGLNYFAHGEEVKMYMPSTPTVFSKFNNALAANNEEIILPREAFKFDYEAELVMVIGKKGKDIPKEDALSYVFGYTAGNDVSARDLQLLTGQWLIGKTCDKFAPIGPCVVTADEIDPQNLEIGSKVNGKIAQLSNTSNMMFKCAELISYISKLITLEPGDIIFTGTPSGVILGKPEGEQNWLKPGDEVEVFIENIGSIKNKLA